MQILLSIKPEFVAKIFSGAKLFEYRKQIFKNPNISTIVIYASRPIGKIVGEFSISSIIIDNPTNIWHQTKAYSGISQTAFFNYFGNKTLAYAIGIKDVKIYPQPLDPYLLIPNFNPPQSFCYLSDEQLRLLKS